MVSAADLLVFMVIIAADKSHHGQVRRILERADLLHHRHRHHSDHCDAIRSAGHGFVATPRNCNTNRARRSISALFVLCDYLFVTCLPCQTRPEVREHLAHAAKLHTKTLSALLAVACR